MRIARTRYEAGRGLIRLVLVSLSVIASGVSSLGAIPISAAPATAGTTTPAPIAESAASVTFHIFATREGLVGSTTATGHVITPNDHFVSLPSTKALNKNVRLTYKGKSVIAPVWDVGPWNTDDDYWNPSDVRVYKGVPRGVPQAQIAYEKNGTGAKNGIDIGDGTFADLGMKASDYVDITFLWMTDDASPAPAAPQPTTPQPAAPKAAAAPKGTIDVSALPVLSGSDAPPLGHTTALGTGYTFISQTGHNMADSIAKYWNSKGGVPALGYPLSELFVRKADGETHVYQYFERVLVEYLPSSDSVTLAPLGSWFAEVNGPYDKVAPFDTTLKKRYVAATGHGIAGGILQWYAANGDNDMFGAPISEEQPYTTTDGRNVTAQLFERARIEMDAAGNITLGRLGAEWLSQRGWL